MMICWRARVRVNVKSQNDKDLFLVYLCVVAWCDLISLQITKMVIYQTPKYRNNSKWVQIIWDIYSSQLNHICIITIIIIIIIMKIVINIDVMVGDDELCDSNQ